MGARVKREIKRDLSLLNANGEALVRRVALALETDDVECLLTPDERRAWKVVSLRNRIVFQVHRRLMKMLRRRGYREPRASVDSLRRGHLGFGKLDERVRDLGDWWSSPAAGSMPACALAVAVNRSVAGDLRRVTLVSDELDVIHLAYAAYSDAATVDRRVVEATKQVRRYLKRPTRWYATGHLGEILDDIEAG